MDNDPTKCDFHNVRVIMFFTNPIGEVAMTFCHVLLLFSGIDNDLPWRPFRMYFPLLLTAYVVHVGVYGILVATGTYTYAAVHM